MQNRYYQKIHPPADMNNVVKYAWIMRCYEKQSPPDLLIPDGYPELIFVHKGAYRKRFVQARQEELIIDQFCFVGIQSRSVIADQPEPVGLISAVTAKARVRPLALVSSFFL